MNKIITVSIIVIVTVIISIEYSSGNIANFIKKMPFKKEAREALLNIDYMEESPAKQHTIELVRVNPSGEDFSTESLTVSKTHLSFQNEKIPFQSSYQKKMPLPQRQNKTLDKYSAPKETIMSERGLDDPPEVVNSTVAFARGANNNSTYYEPQGSAVSTYGHEPPSAKIKQVSNVINLAAGEPFIDRNNISTISSNPWERIDLFGSNFPDVDCEAYFSPNAGNDANSGRLPELPVQTLQAALAVLANNCSPFTNPTLMIMCGETIRLDEPIVLKNYEFSRLLNLKSFCPNVGGDEGMPVIQSDNSPALAVYGNVTISSVILRGTPVALIGDCSYCRIERVVIEDSLVAALLRGVISFTQNVVINNLDGIYVVGETGETVVIVADNLFYNNQENNGNISLNEETLTLLREFRNSPASSNINVSENSFVWIENNYNFRSGSGIYGASGFAEAPRLRIVNNIFADNDQDITIIDQNSIEQNQGNISTTFSLNTSESFTLGMYITSILNEEEVTFIDTIRGNPSLLKAGTTELRYAPETVRDFLNLINYPSILSIQE